MKPDYLILGHITRDILADGSSAPGGTAMYAALTARRLGMHTAVVSALATLPADWPADIHVSFTASLHPPTFENRYTPQGRLQMLHAAAEPLKLADIPNLWRSTRIIHLGPILAETPEPLLFSFPEAFIGVTPQGWMREWDAPLPSPIQYRRWQPSPLLLNRINALVLSIEDVRGDEELVRSYANHCQLVVLTRSAHGAILFLNGTPHQIAAFPAVERDPTGAGDVFAAAFFIRFAETHDPFEAATFAAAVAAASVEATGAQGVPTRDQVALRRQQAGR